MYVYAKAAEQLRARELRRQGGSLRQIARELGVALSSVSNWVRDIPRGMPRAEPAEAAEPTSEAPTEPAETRRCGRCRHDLPLDAFNRRADGYQWWCRECFREYFRRRGALHVKQSGAARKRRRKIARQIVEEHLATHPCADCGETDRRVLEFDHLDEKRGNVAALMQEGFGAKTLRAEIAKCDVVCVNCHRRRTAARSRSWRLLTGSLDGRVQLDPIALRNLIYVRDVLIGSVCTDCGVDDLLVLEFDHVRGEKVRNVMQLARAGYSLRRVEQEIAKCEVRCANCHRRRTLAQEHGFLRAVS